MAKAENIRDSFPNIQIVKWGEVPDFDMIINATSLGLKGFGELEFDNLKVGPNKFFYDIIYNPTKTNGGKLNFPPFFNFLLYYVPF